MRPLSEVVLPRGRLRETQIRYALQGCQVEIRPRGLDLVLVAKDEKSENALYEALAILHLRPAYFDD